MMSHQMAVNIDDDNNDDDANNDAANDNTNEQYENNTKPKM